jgi:hypothetical protein
MGLELDYDELLSLQEDDGGEPIYQPIKLTVNTMEPIDPIDGEFWLDIS